MIYLLSKAQGKNTLNWWKDAGWPWKTRTWWHLAFAFKALWWGYFNPSIDSKVFVGAELILNYFHIYSIQLGIWNKVGAYQSVWTIEEWFISERRPSWEALSGEPSLYILEYNDLSILCSLTLHPKVDKLALYPSQFSFSHSQPAFTPLRWILLLCAKLQS